MDSKSFLDWWPVWTQTIAYVVIAIVGWQKLVEKVNGQGGRVTAVENRATTLETTVDRHDRDLFEYRRDAQEATKGLARVEKGIDAMSETITQGNIALGVQLAAMEKTIQEKDVRAQIRLTRIETVARIEDKIGPLPTE